MAEPFGTSGSEGEGMNRIRILAAACAAAVFFTLVGTAAAATARRTDVPAPVCGVSQSCISFKTKVVGGPEPYLNFQVTLCEGSPLCEVPDISTSYTNGESDADPNVDAGATYYLVGGQSHATDAALANLYTTGITCASSGPGATVQALTSGYGQVALQIPESTIALVSCTITDTYIGPPLPHAKKAKKAVKKALHKR
jgi:hypothetical protein